MRRYAHGEAALMAYLQQALDDPSPARWQMFGVYQLPSPSHALRRAMAPLIATRGVDIEIEPQGGRPRCARSAGSALCRRLCRRPGWSEELLALQRTGYGTIPPELLAGAVEALRRWSRVWPQRPTAVVAAPAHSVEMRANIALAQHIAAVGKLPFLDLFSWSGDAVDDQLSSGPVVAHLDATIRLDRSVEVPTGPVLLCATTMRTGWSLTVSAALLHDAGCTTTMPLVIHRLP